MLGILRSILGKLRAKNDIDDGATAAVDVPAADEASSAPATQPPPQAEPPPAPPAPARRPVTAGSITDPRRELVAQSMDKLMRDDYAAVAERLGCRWEAVAAVALVESGEQGGFDAVTRLPIILFERHLFSRKTGGKFDASHPRVSSPRAGGYAATQQGQWVRLMEAFELVPEAALESASWGRFQILGQNWHKNRGVRSVHEFVRKLATSEDEQLLAFENFIVANKLADELRDLNWAGFASRYNGPNYRANRYDEKMAATYAKILRQEL